MLHHMDTGELEVMVIRNKCKIHLAGHQEVYSTAERCACMIICVIMCHLDTGRPVVIRNRI